MTSLCPYDLSGSDDEDFNSDATSKESHREETQISTDSSEVVVRDLLPVNNKINKRQDDCTECATDFFGLNSPSSESDDDNQEPKWGSIRSQRQSKSFWKNGELEILEKNNERSIVPSLFRPELNFQKNTFPNRRKRHQQNHCDIFSENEACTAGYISKRTKIKYEENRTNNQHSKATNKQDKKIFFVHHRISPALGQQSSKNKMPNHNMVSIVAHCGAVNKINWCKSEYSHLLLSCSMDRTVKIWNVFSTVEHCVQSMEFHTKAVKDAVWTKSGREILSCGYDKVIRLCDVEKGVNIQTFEQSSFVTCIKYHPLNHHVFISGANNTICSWDTRMKPEPVGIYAHKEPFGQVHDLAFLKDAKEFISCSDLVSRDSADKNVMVWDFNSGAILSNQIYQERYTCSCLQVHPYDQQFVAQTNGNYIALFSTVRPYRMNKTKRYEGHKVEGYNIGCDFSPDGALLTSGSASGCLHFYDYKTTRLLKKLTTDHDVCMDVKYHPILHSTVASSSWNGCISIWQ